MHKPGAGVVVVVAGGGVVSISGAVQDVAAIVAHTSHATVGAAQLQPGAVPVQLPETYVQPNAGKHFHRQVPSQVSGGGGTHGMTVSAQSAGVPTGYEQGQIDWQGFVRRYHAPLMPVNVHSPPQPGRGVVVVGSLVVVVVPVQLIGGCTSLIVHEVLVIAHASFGGQNSGG